MSRAGAIDHFPQLQNEEGINALHLFLRLGIHYHLQDITFKGSPLGFNLSKRTCQRHFFCQS